VRTAWALRGETAWVGGKKRRTLRRVVEDERELCAECVELNTDKVRKIG